MPSDPEPATPKRDLDDELYLPNAPGSRHITQAKTSKKRKTLSSLPSYVKKNVIMEIARLHNEPTSDRPRCVVTGASDRRTTIEYSRVVSGLTPSKEVDCLEWAWNMEYYSLHLDTRRNIQTLSICLHRWFNKTSESKPVGWFWIPCNLNVVSTMHNTYVGSLFIAPTVDETTNVRQDPDSFYEGLESFEYRFVPLPNMDEYWSVRRYQGDFLGPYNPGLVVDSVYPFHDLPHFELSVPYHFVIANTGKKLYQIYGTGEINLATDFHFLSAVEKIMLVAIRNIYVAWIKATLDQRWLIGIDHEQGGKDPPVDQTPRGEPGSGVSRKGKGAPPGGEGGGGRIAPGPANAPKAQRHAAAGSLAPWDSASCLELSEDGDRGDEEKPFVDAEARTSSSTA